MATASEDSLQRSRGRPRVADRDRLKPYLSGVRIRSVLLDFLAAGAERTEAATFSVWVRDELARETGEVLARHSDVEVALARQNGLSPGALRRNLGFDTDLGCVRISREQHDRCKLAATLTGRTLADFVRETLVKGACVALGVGGAPAVPGAASRAA